MKRDKTTVFVICACGLIPVIWISLLLAPYVYGGLPEMMGGFAEALKNPLSIKWMEDSLKTILLFFSIYVLSIFIYFATRRNYRRGIEHGSAKWGDCKEICKKYKDKNKENKLLTQNVCIGIDGKKHRRNTNILVCGGSGSGKSRSFSIVNVMQANTSFFVLDTKGEIIRATGGLLEEHGYEVRVLDLINMNRSHCYNPFVYLQNDNDVQRLVTNLFKATSPKDGAKSNDPFWDTASSMLLLSLVYYLWYEAPKNEQNFSMVMELLRAGEVKEDDDEYQSPLDELFERLQMSKPEHIAVKYYNNYRTGSAKTLKSIQITLASRLEKFNLNSLASLTSTDEMELSTMGEKKVALFALIPDNDSSFNFLISILYTQLFQQLFFCADHKHGGSLPVHVHFVMDEFCNLQLPNDFCKLLAVMRSRSISASIIIQNISSLKAIFEREWESIIGNCDEFVYLGGNEQSTHKFVSELLGKETLSSNTYTKSSGRNGNYSTNLQILGRELLTPDEVRMLDNRYALLFIRGERPIKDLKYDLIKHPDVALTVYGGAKAYVHGDITKAVASITFNDNSSRAEAIKINDTDSKYEILTEDELEDILNGEKL